MILSEINTKVNSLTKADTTEYPVANRVIDLNIWNQKVVTWILAAQDSSDFDDANHSGYSTLYTSLVANQRDYRFGISDKVVAIKRVEISYDASKSYVSSPIDSVDVNIGLSENYTEIDNHFSTTAPGHDWKYNALFIFPEPTASVGQIEVEVSRSAYEFTSSDYNTGTKTPGFDPNFHPILPYGMSYEFFISNLMLDEAAKMEQIISDYRASLVKQYGKKEQNYPLQFGANYIDYR